MILCKHCGSDVCVRNGLVKGKQRYLCKECNKTTREGDLREKYTLEQKLRVVKLYSENVGLRSIERIESIPTPLLIHWISNFAKIIKDKLRTTDIPEDVKSIAILEMDELRATS